MSKAIPILRITPHLFRDGVWPVAYDPLGGLQTQVWRMTKELEKMGISQTVLTSRIPGSPRHTKHSETIRVDCVGISLSKFLAPRLLGATWFIGVVRYLLTHRSNFELVHIHYNHWVWCRILTFIVHRLRIPVVVSLSTELWVSSNYRRLVSSKYFNLARWIERQALRSSDGIIALTEKDADHWTRDLNLNPGEIVVIPDAIDASLFRKQIDEDILRSFRKSHNIPQDKKIVTYIGRIRTEKGWQDLPTITRGLGKSGAFVLICGDGPDRRKLENALQESACQDNWRITGFLCPDEVRAALQITDVLILPSRREAFGSVLLEAMATGVPAVAYAVGGIIEVAGTPHAIRLIPPTDKSAFTDAILKILSDKQQCDFLIAQGQQRVEDFSLKRAAHEMLNTYQTLLRPGIPSTIHLNTSAELEI